MRKIFAVLLCVLIMFAVSFSTFAEEVEKTEAETVGESISIGAETEADNDAALVTERIVSYLQEHLEEISVIITMILTVFYQIRKHASLNRSIGTLNNNSIAIAENSSAAMEGVSSAVTGYKSEIAALLGEYRQSAEEKKRLETSLSAVEGYLKTARLANVELANEVAELLVLANIPNSKKEELYARHRAAVQAIDAAYCAEERQAEVIQDDGSQA